MFLWLKTLYRKRAVTWPFIFTQLYGLYRVNEIVTFANGEQLEMGKRSIDKLKNFMQEKIENESF